MMAKLGLLMCVFITLSLLLETSRCFKLDSRCSYFRDDVHCKRANLTYIPGIPSNVCGLVFSDNYLPHVDSFTFRNISNPKKIRYLRLEYDHIQTISNDSFENFTELFELSLSGNHVETLSLTNLLGVLCHLKLILALNAMGPATRSPETFSRMDNCKLRALDLEDNNYKDITPDFVQHFDEVKYLRLDRNRIEVFQLPVMKHLKKLSLSHNYLTEVPNFCMENQTSHSLVPEIQTFYVDYNRIMVICPTNFDCLTSLTKLFLNGNQISVFPNDMLMKMPFIYSLSIESNSDYETYIDQYALRSNTLTSLYLTSFGPGGTVFRSVNDTFRHTPNLRNLHMSYINMYMFETTSVQGLFAPLKLLENFTCYKCGIQQNPSLLIGDMEELIKLNLERNYLESISDNSISSKRTLKFLYLSRNKIVHLAQQHLPTEFLNQLEMFDISNNPFSCDCSLKWFIDWLKTKHTKTYNADKYICAGPKHVAGKPLLNVSFTYFECHSFRTFKLVMISGGSSLLVILIIIGIVHYNRWNIRRAIYLKRMRRNYIQIEGNNFLYDAFVSYNKEDSGWVTDRLLPKLETEYGYKLCILERDFKIGTFLSDNTLQSINDSKMILLVLSDSFANNDCCKFQLKVALSKRIEEKIPLIVITLQKLEHMNITMKTLLKLSTCLEWKGADAEEDLFWNKLQEALKG